MASTREQVPRDIRLTDADTLVSLRRKGESIGLSGRWSSDQLADLLPRGSRFPIRVMLINHATAPVSYAPLEGLCYRCLVAIPSRDGTYTQFQIDLDSVDFKNLELMSSQDLLQLTHHLLDRVNIEGSEPS